LKIQENELYIMFVQQLAIGKENFALRCGERKNELKTRKSAKT